MRLSTAGNTLVPAILALESAGFVVSLSEEHVFMAVRGEGVFVGSPTFWPRDRRVVDLE